MRTRTDEPRVCGGCGKAEKQVNLQRGDDNVLRCDGCARARRIELCPVKRTDLRSITRRMDRCLTTVQLTWDWQTQIDWLVFGAAHVQHHDHNKTHQLCAYMTEGVTDFEHDSAYALRLPLIGMQWTGTHYHVSTFVAWVDPSCESNDFRVPLPGYDPTKLPEAVKCTDKRCGREGHIIVPEGNYCPPSDVALYKLVRGKRVEINIGAAVETEEPAE